MTISEKLAGFAVSLREEDLPAGVWERARTHFVDTLACMFLGTDSQSVKRALPYVKTYGGSAQAAFPGGLWTDAAHCAMLGAIAAHSNDFDDMSSNLNGHPSALLVPVVLALGQKENVTGREMLMAYIAGVEIDAILGRMVQEAGYPKGWNPTTAIGIFGGVAAAGRLLGLDRKEMTHAFGMAVNESAGFKANYGTFAKDLAIGTVAAKAVLLAESAKSGFDASRDAFEGPFGFFRNVTGAAEGNPLAEPPEKYRSDFLFPGLIMKPYPSCRGNHSGIDCITRIVRRHAFRPEDVRQIVCKVDQAAWDTDRYERPETPSQAKFSLAFCVAKVVCGGQIEIQDFLGEDIRDRAPLALLPKIRIVCAPEEFPESRFGTEVRVDLTDGGVYTEKACYAKGDPACPMTQEEIDCKLRACLEIALGAGEAEKMMARLLKFDRLPQVREIFSL